VPGYFSWSGPVTARADDGPKELALGFVAAGLAMLVVMIMASRTAAGAARGRS
jgi:hypothetical protein